MFGKGHSQRYQGEGGLDLKKRGNKVHIMRSICKVHFLWNYLIFSEAKTEIANPGRDEGRLKIQKRNPLEEHGGGKIRKIKKPEKRKRKKVSEGRGRKEGKRSYQEKKKVWK